MKMLKILLIDDNPDDRLLVIRELKKEFDFEIEEVFDATGLMRALKDFNYDIIITDYHLKWNTGLEILNQVKSLNPQCPVIMFTGMGNEEIAVSAMKAGLDDYVEKSPKHFKRLVGAVKLVLDRSWDRREKERYHKAFHMSEKKFQNIFESSPNAISISDLDGTIIECNRAMQDLSGFESKSEIIGKNSNNLIALKDRVKTKKYLERCFNGDPINNMECSILRKNGSEVPVELSIGLITDLSGIPVSYVSSLKDISEQKKAEYEMKKRMMKFQIDDGKLYLVLENIPSLSHEAFLDLLKVGYFGFVISRVPEKDFKKVVINSDFDFYWLSERENEKTIKPDLNKIERMIEKLSTKSCILIERLDYIIFKNGFKNTLFFVQHLREFAYLGDKVIILSIDPTIVKPKELILLKRECLEIELRHIKKKLSDKFFKILKFLYQENCTGIKPSYIEIGHELDLSKPTVRKRVRYLISTGYIVESTRGRRKVVELTEVGRNIFF